MFSNLTISRMSRKLLAGLLMSVTVVTSFMLAPPEPALSSTPVSIPVTVLDEQGNQITTTKKFKLEICHEGTGQWSCSFADTDSAGNANVSVSLPNGSGFVQLSAGGYQPDDSAYDGRYAQTWQRVTLRNGVADWNPILMLRPATWITATVQVNELVNNVAQAVKFEGVELSTQVGQGQNSWTMRQWAQTNDQGLAEFKLESQFWSQNPIEARIGAGGWSLYEEKEQVISLDATPSTTITARSMKFKAQGVVRDDFGLWKDKELCLIFYSRSGEQFEIDFRTDADDGKYEVDNLTQPWFRVEPHRCGYMSEEMTYDPWHADFLGSQLDTTISKDIHFQKTGIEVTAFEVVNGQQVPAPFVSLRLYPQPVQGEAPPSADDWREAVTDKDGKAYFANLLEDKVYELSYKAEYRMGERPRYLDTSTPTVIRTLDRTVAELEQNPQRNRIKTANLVLQPSGNFPSTPVSLTGNVIDKDGDEVPFATVEVSMYFNDSGPGNYTQFRFKADANGSFALTGLPHGQINVRVSARGYRASELSFEASESSPTDEHDLGSFRIRPGLPGNQTYSGLLKDTSGMPISNTRLTLILPYGSGGESDSIRKTTDDDGEFSFENLTPGHYHIYADTNYQMYEWSVWSFQLGTGEDRVANLVLVERGKTNAALTASISGRVLEYRDVDGPSGAVPIQGLCVAVYPIEGGMPAEGRTDASGNWTATGLANGEEYYISEPMRCIGDQTPGPIFDFENKYEYPWDSPRTAFASVSGGIPHEWLYREVSRTGTGSISGRVKDGVDYSNLAGVTVNVTRARGGLQVPSVTTDSRGEYLVPDLPAGEYHLHIVGDEIDYWDSWVAVDVNDVANRANVLLYAKEDTDETEGWVEWEGEITGSVSDETDTVMGGARIEAYNSNEPSWGYVGSAISDNQGRFTLSYLPTGIELFIKVIPQWVELGISFVTGLLIPEDSKVLELDQAIESSLGGSISGELLDIPQGVEVRSVSAELIDSDGVVVSSTPVNMKTGRYNFTQVPAGQGFQVRFSQNSSSWDWYSGSGNSVSMKPVFYMGNSQLGTPLKSQAQTVVVGQGENLTGRNVTFSEGSSIQGTVAISSADGPISFTGSRSIQVSLFQLVGEENWVWFASTQVSATTGYGFQFVGLPQGSYKIEFYDYTTGNNTLLPNWNGGAEFLEDALPIPVGESGTVSISHVMEVAPPQKSAEAFDLDDLGAEALAELKDLIDVNPDAAPGSELDIFVGTEFAGEYVSAFANSTPVLLGDWKQVDSRGYITVTIPTTLPAGSHRIAAQDSRGVVFGWAPISIKSPDTVSANPATNPAATEAKPAAPKSIVDSDDEEEEKKQSANNEEIVAAPDAVESSSANWLFPLAGGFLMLVVAGSAWVLRSRRGRYSRK